MNKENIEEAENHIIEDTVEQNSHKVNSPAAAHDFDYYLNYKKFIESIWPAKSEPMESNKTNNCQPCQVETSSSSSFSSSDDPSQTLLGGCKVTEV